MLTMVKALHHSCVSHELLFHTLKELAAIKYFRKAGHPADLHQSKQCLKDSSMTPLYQWKAFPVAQASLQFKSLFIWMVRLCLIFSTVSHRKHAV